MAIGSIIFLSLFLLIIAALIGVAIYGSLKDKKSKQSELDKLHEIESVASAGHVKSYLILDSLVSFIEEKLNDFSEDATSVSIGNLNEVAKNTVQHLIDSREIQKLYQSEDRRAEFEPVLNELLNTKATLWFKEAYFSVSLIRNKAQIYKDSPEYKKEANEAQSIKWN